MVEERRSTNVEKAHDCVDDLRRERVLGPNEARRYHTCFFLQCELCRISSVRGVSPFRHICPDSQERES
jgi:hypothetical protein